MKNCDNCLRLKLHFDTNPFTHSSILDERLKINQEVEITAQTTAMVRLSCNLNQLLEVKYPQLHIKYNATSREQQLIRS